MKMQTKNPLMYMEKERQGKALLPSWVKTGIIAACFGSDAFTFYVLFDKMFTQGQGINIFLAILCSLSINMFPMLLSYLLSRQGITNFERVMAGVFAAAFIAVLAVTFVIRVDSKEALFESSETPGIEAKNAVADTAAEAVYTTAQNATAVLMGCMPCVTSLIVFGLTYANPRDTRIHTLKEQQIRLKETIDTMEVNLGLLQQELADHDLEGYDDARYRAAVQTIGLIQQYAQIVARRVLAQRLGTALACTMLMEENSLKAQIEGNLAGDLIEAQKEEAL